jgi:hypothetical protein
MNVLAIVHSPPRFPAIGHFRDLPPLQAVLTEPDQDLALSMFRDELRDTKEIAWRLEATEAAVANGIARARERGRRI